MELALGKVVLLYLLLPLIGLILGGLMFVVAKKNDLLGDKKIIFYFLLTCIILALPGLFGFIDYWFMPYVYIGLQLLYFLLGWYNLKILYTIKKELKEKGYYVEFLLIFVIMILSAGLFSLIFNLCNELQYGIWASTCLLPFIFTSLFRKAYYSYMDIPLEIYKIWSYDKEAVEVSTDHFDSSRITVVELELFKQVSDLKPLSIKAKASEDMPFGVWFKIFIDDYNRKSPQSPVIYSDLYNSYGWIFYVNTSILGRKRYVDPDMSFMKNKIRESNVIMAKRTQYEEKESIDE